MLNTNMPQSLAIRISYFFFSIYIDSVDLQSLIFKNHLCAEDAHISSSSLNFFPDPHLAYLTAGQYLHLDVLKHS